MKKTSLKKLVGLCGLASIVGLSGCATSKTPGDPYESLNRKTFAFNMKADKYVLRPVAKGYNAITPNYVQARVTNFFNNTGEIPATVNDILQLNLYQTLADSSRFIINTTLGIGGLYDVAKYGDLPQHHNDFGLTMARWGYKDSAYFVVPILGPSTVRDTAGLPVDTVSSPWFYVQPFWISYAAFGLDKINIRAALLPSDKLVDQAFDPYVFVRDAYLQLRQNEVNAVLNKEVPVAAASATATTSTTSNETGDTFVSGDSSITAGEAGAVRVNQSSADGDTFVADTGASSTADATTAKSTTSKTVKKKKHPMQKLPAPTQLLHH